MTTQAYRPSSGSEGAHFMEVFCFRCERDRDFRENDGDSCPIAAATMAFPADDPNYPREWIEDEDGPRCTAFQMETNNGYAS